MSEVLEKYFNPENIRLAFYRVNCGTDKMVKDRVGIRAFGIDLDSNAKSLSEKICSGNYEPQRGFKFYVPKASKTLRTKTLLYIEDALVYQAIANKIAEEVYEILAEQNSFVFGSVLSPDVVKGEAILGEAEPNYFFFKLWHNFYKKFTDSRINCVEKDGVKFKFETDITGFFDCIPHYNLLCKLSDRFGVEDEILDILSACLDLWSGTCDSPTPGVGIPQGPVPSFLFANLILHDLDEQIIAEGFKYYRYMDDICIYGYEEKELVKALVLIDKYLKSNGLSINAKKTSIEKIKDGFAAEERKKIQSFSLYFDEDPNNLVDELKHTTKTEKDLIASDSNTVSEQDIGFDQNYKEKILIETLTSKDDIEAFCNELLMEVEDSLPKLFAKTSLKNNDLLLRDRVSDRDFMSLSFQYAGALKALQEIGLEVKPNQKLLKYWLFAYKNFFWRANCFGFMFQFYRNNEKLKKSLLKLIKNDFELYEWSRYLAFQTLSFSQDFNDQELRHDFFKMLKNEDSSLVKISIYRLLFIHASNDQMVDLITKTLKNEENNYLKIVITDFCNYNLSDNFNVETFIDNIGL
jgi:hypothetical protein